MMKTLFFVAFFFSLNSALDSIKIFQMNFFFSSSSSMSRKENLFFCDENLIKVKITFLSYFSQEWKGNSTFLLIFIISVVSHLINRSFNWTIHFLDRVIHLYSREKSQKCTFIRSQSVHDEREEEKRFLLRKQNSRNFIYLSAAQRDAKKMLESQTAGDLYEGV